MDVSRETRPIAHPGTDPVDTKLSETDPQAATHVIRGLQDFQIPGPNKLAYR